VRSRIAFLLVALTAAPLFAQPLLIRTLAGSRTGGGFANAFGVSARFSAPRAVAADAAGNLWIADTGNHVIRRVTPAGDVTTIAGEPGVAGFADGTGSIARFRFPAGIAVDPVSGAIWISDKDNHVIRRMTPDGTVTTIAGQPGVAGSADAQGTAAKFAFPRGLVVDPGGAVYVADTQNQVIRRVTADGVAITYAGRMLADGSANGTLTDARFRTPSDVALDASGNLYVSDTGNDRIRKIANGMVTTFAESFDGPWGLDVDPSGNVYVADHDDQRLRRVTPAGDVTTLTSDDLPSPSGLAFANGAVYVTDALNHALHRVDPATGAVTTVAGSVPMPGLFHLPYAVASDATGNTYVANGDAIEKIAPGGGVTTLATGFGLVSSIAMGPDGNLYVADVADARVYRVTPAGSVATVAGTADVISSSGMVSTFAGTGTPGWVDGSAGSSRFRSPSGIAVDAARNVYVTDFGNDVVRKYTRATGLVSTIVRPEAGLNAPSGIVADGDGNLYVADYNHAIYRVTSAGMMTLVAGLPGTPGNVDGTGTRARFAYPEGLALTTAGELLIADSYNHAIRVGRVFDGPHRRRVVRR
jgi:sugar lactone lactonase YvrE